MLDFYLIDDSDRDPEFPVEERYAGSLSVKDVQFLELHAGLTFDYYADARYSSQEVVVLYDRLREVQESEDVGVVPYSYKRLHSIVQEAVEREQGLIAFCD